MTIAVRISNEEQPPSTRTLLVTTLAYDKGKLGTRPIQQQHISPGKDALFHVHMLSDLHIEELPPDY